MSRVATESLHDFQSVARDQHQSEHLSGVQVVRQELHKFVPSIGLIKKRSVHGVERDHDDVARLRAVEAEVAKLSGGNGRRDEAAGAGRQFLEVCDADRLAVLENREVFFVEPMKVIAGFIGDDDRNLDQYSLRAE